jgi:hypothetical protein
MTSEQERHIENLEGTLRYFGYAVDMEPIPGAEDDVIAALRRALSRVESVLAANAKRFGFRGTSKPALAALHRDLPQPGWGVEVRAVVA